VDSINQGLAELVANVIIDKHYFKNPTYALSDAESERGSNRNI
jgi:hypothetical protein